MHDHRQLAARVADEQGDVLGALQLVHGDGVLQGRLFDQLVDLLVEGMFLDLREDYLGGALDHADYVDAVSELADACTRADLLPLPSRPG